VKRFLAILGIVTLGGLFYVYEEVEAMRIGYTIRKQEESKVQMLDHTRALKYNIARLKAPHVLEKRLISQRIDLQAPKSWQTLVLSNGAVAKNAAASASLQRAPFFSRFFVGTAQAEAKETQAR